MALVLFGTGITVGIIGSVAESKYFSTYAEAGAGATPFLLVATGFWAMILGFQVESAWKKYLELAKADGEHWDRYSLPNLYVDGNTKHAKAFNCVQCSHQHIFETFPHMCTASLIAWMSYLIASVVTTLTYSVGQYYLSTSYANSEGEPEKHNSSPLAIGTWYGLVATTTLGLLSALKMSLKEKMW